MRLTRRSFLSRAFWSAGAAVAALASACSRGTLTGPGAPEAALRAGKFGGEITLSPPADEILASIRATARPFYHQPGRFYLVPYDTSTPGAETYVRQGVADGGLMALYQRCTHLGCRVPFCQTSKLFECPCHGPQFFNLAGEYVVGPAPRGLDRFPLRVKDGRVTVDTSVIVTGPERGFSTVSLDPEGPECVETVRRPDVAPS